MLDLNSRIPFIMLDLTSAADNQPISHNETYPLSRPPVRSTPTAGTATAPSYHGTSRGSAFLTLVPSSLPSILSPPPPPGAISVYDSKPAALPRSFGKLSADVTASQSSSHRGQAGVGVAAASVSASAGAGASSLVLVEPSLQEGGDARRMDFLMSDFSVPEQKTTYACRVSASVN